MNRNQGAESTLAYLWAELNNSAGQRLQHGSPSNRESRPERSDTRSCSIATRDNPILTARDWPYPAHTVFNAGACQLGEETVLLVRVEDRRGHSHLTVARSNDGVSNWRIDAKPSFAADPANYPEEAWGVEDARLTWVEDRGQWIIAYTAYSHSGPLVSLAETKDFISLHPARSGHAPRGQRRGRLSPPLRQSLRDDSPAGFRGEFGRPHLALLLAGPDHWGDHRILLHARRGAWWDANKIGLGPPPLETPEGWLILYHGVRVTAGGCLYRLGWPCWTWKILAGFCGAATNGSSRPRCPTSVRGTSTASCFPAAGFWTSPAATIRLYYGGADTCLALATAQAFRRARLSCARAHAWNTRACANEAPFE